MPRFYLHVCNGNGFVEDEEGAELPNVEAARIKAIEGLRDLLASELRGGELNMASFIEIEDESRQLIMTVPFMDAVKVTTRHGKRPADKRPERREPQQTLSAAGRMRSRLLIRVSV